MKRAESKLDGFEGIEANGIRAMMYIHRASILYQQGKFKEAKADCLCGLSVVNETNRKAKLQLSANQ
jgi:hypothetical protein